MVSGEEVIPNGGLLVFRCSDIGMPIFSESLVRGDVKKVVIIC